MTSSANQHQVRIGEVAEQSGVRVETVRYYEREGLIPKAKRQNNGYRYFTSETVARIRFIQRAQSLGFTLPEIRELLSLKADSANSCRSVRTRAQRKLADIEEKIKTLERMRNALLPLLKACEPEKPVDDCPILKALDQ